MERMRIQMNVVGFPLFSRENPALMRMRMKAVRTKKPSLVAGAQPQP